MNFQALAAPLLGFALTVGSCAQDPGEAQPSPSPAPSAEAPASAPEAAPATVITVRTADEGLAEAVRNGDFFRWALPRLEGLRVEVGPAVQGEPRLIVDRLPGTAATRELLSGLPVELSAEAIVLAGTRYPAAGHAVALRLPESSTWVVAGEEEQAVALAE